MRTLTTPRLTAGLVAFAMAGCGQANSDDEISNAPLGTARQALSCTDNQVPPMTGFETPSGRISRSGVFSGQYEAFQAFDGKPSLWLSATFQTPAWIQYEWSDAPRTITGYAIRYANGRIISRAPKDWTLQGYDGRTWVVIDTRSIQTAWRGVERREFEVASPGAYWAYRLNITDDNDVRAGVVVASIDELELLGCDPDAVACQAYIEPADGACSRPEEDACRFQDPDCPRRLCGARAGQTCSSSEYCAYEAGEYCGAADASSTCEPRPTQCKPSVNPVCACNRRTYTNACEAARAGFGVLNSGICQ